MRATRDRYGFIFWLRWITTFAGSFVVSAIAWTLLLTQLFGGIKGEELMLTWTVAVFGTWFILVIPFMRKKEQIWKRLNQDQEKSVDAWFTGIGFFIGFFVLSAFTWDLALKDRIFPNAPGLDPVWMKAVFGTWLVILIPLLIWMYRSADRIFRIAHARQTYEPHFRSLSIAPARRRLPADVAALLKGRPAALPGGHVARLKLKNGVVLSHAFILNGMEVAGIYDYKGSDFDASQIEALELLSPADFPAYEETLWVRFNNVS